MSLLPGDKIRIARDSQTPPWSQRDLAKVAGVPHHTIANWELNPPRRYNEEHLAKIARALNIPVSWFWDPEDRMVPSDVRGAGERRVEYGFTLTAAIRSWRSALAAIDAVEDGYFEQSETPHEVPTAFLIGLSSKLDYHDVVSVSGTSMSPRINPGDRVLFYRDQTPRPNTIVMAESPDGRVFVKVLRFVAGHFELHSIAAHGATFQQLAGWKILGYALAIMGDHERNRNIEWDGGSPLKA